MSNIYKRWLQPLLKEKVGPDQFFNHLGSMHDLWGQSRCIQMIQGINLVSSSPTCLPYLLPSESCESGLHAYGSE